MRDHGEIAMILLKSSLTNLMNKITHKNKSILTGFDLPFYIHNNNEYFDKVKLKLLPNNTHNVLKGPSIK